MGIFAGLLLRRLANDIEERRYVQREEREAQDHKAGLVAQCLITPESERDAETHFALVTYQAWYREAFAQALATLPPGPAPGTAATADIEPWHGSAFRTYPAIEGHVGTGWVSLGGGHRALVTWVQAADGIRWVLAPTAVAIVGGVLGSSRDQRVRVAFDLERAWEGHYYTAQALDEFGRVLSQATTPENEARKVEVKKLHQRVVEGLSTPEAERDYATNYSLVWDSYDDTSEFRSVLATLPPGPGGVDAKATPQRIASPWRPGLIHTIEGHFTTGWVELGRGHRAHVGWIEDRDGTQLVLDAEAVAAVRSVLATRAEGPVRVSVEETPSGDQLVTAEALSP